MSVPNVSPSRAARWTGRSLSGVAIVFLAFDGATKLVPIEPVTTAMQALGFVATDTLARGLGLLLACTALYAIPRTTLTGAVLLTGYLGGAIAIQLRAGNPLFSHLLFGAYIGLFVWAGLLLRRPRLRSLLSGGERDEAPAGRREPTR